MSVGKNWLASLWGAAAFCFLWYGLAHRSAHVLLLSAALAPSLVVIIWWIIDRADLERRINRLEARSEIAAEKRVVMQTNLTDVENKLQQVETRVSSTENIKATM